MVGIAGHSTAYYTTALSNGEHLILMASIFPDLMMFLCRSRGCENVVKITDTENGKNEPRREQFLLKEGVAGLASKASDLVTADLKEDVGTIV